MDIILKHGLRFIFFLLVQVLILNQLEIGAGTLIMIYPLFIFLLPVETNIFVLLITAFGLGLLIDSLSNTFGLHASSLLVFAYLRPIIFKVFAPRDGYEQIGEVHLFTMGFSWFLKTFGTLLIIHHFWFFMLEMFKLNELLFIFQKVLISTPLTFLLCVLLQYLFIRKTKSA